MVNYYRFNYQADIKTLNLHLHPFQRLEKFVWVGLLLERTYSGKLLNEIGFEDNKAHLTLTYKIHRHLGTI